MIPLTYLLHIQNYLIVNALLKQYVALMYQNKKTY